jgi:hypothetical protein
MSHNTKLLKKKINEFKNLDILTTSIEDYKTSLMEIMKGYRCWTFYLGDQYFYRARINKKDKLFTNVSELYYPKPEDIKTQGRMNRVGVPLFYLAASHQTALLEVRPKKGDILTIIRYKLKNTDDRLHLMELGVAETQFQHNLEKTYNIVENTMLRNKFKNKEAMEINLMIRSFIASELMKIIPQREEYRYNKTIAIYEILTKSDEIDGVLYPSIAGDGLRRSGATCVAINPNSANNLFKPVVAMLTAVENINAKSEYEMNCTKNSKLIVDENIIWE